MKQLPIACTLTRGELTKRRAHLGYLFDRIAGRRVTDRRFLAKFEPSKRIIADLASFVGGERDCCPFLRFSIIAEEDHGPVWLSVAGPPGTGRFIEQMAAVDGGKGTEHAE